MSAATETLTFYKAVQRGIRREAGKALRPVLKRWRYTQSSDYTDAALKPGSRRFLIRYGLLDNENNSARIASEYQTLLARISRSSGDAPGVAGAWLDLFAEGEYGVLPQGICAEEPRCSSCPVSSACRFRANQSDVRSLETRAVEALRNAREGETPKLKSAELLAFLVYHKEGDSADVARMEGILRSTNGLRGLLTAEHKSLQPAGLTDIALARLKAVAELCRQWADEKALCRPSFTCGRDFFDHYHLRLRDRKKELVVAALLDQKNQLIGEEQISEGTLTEALVHPREVFARAIAQRAAALALIHNHPSGDPTPSLADKALTRRLSSVSRLIGIRLLDHVIVGDGRYFSFVDSGLL